MVYKLLVFFILFSLFSQMTEAARFAYLPNQKNNTLNMVDLENETLLLEVSVGSKPYGVAVNPKGDRVYVTNSESGTVSVFDTSIRQLIATIPVGEAPKGIAVSPDGRYVYVAVFGTHNLAVIDAGKNEVINVSQTMGLHPWGVAVDPIRQRLYISNYGIEKEPGQINRTGEISVCDISKVNPICKVVFNLSLQAGGHSRPKGIAVYQNKLYISGFDHAVRPFPYHVLRLKIDSFDIWKLEAEEISETVEDPCNLSVSEDGSKVYVASPSEQKILVHDSGSLEPLTSIDTESAPQGLNTLGPSHLYVSMGSSLSLFGMQNPMSSPLSEIFLNNEGEFVAFGKFVGPDLKSLITVDPHQLFFTDQSIAQSSSIQKIALTVKNISTTLDNIYISGEDFKFSLEGTTCKAQQEMKVGESCEVAIIFQPKSSGEKSESLTVKTIRGDIQTVLVTGKAFTPSHPANPPSPPIESQVDDDQTKLELLDRSSRGCSLNQTSPFHFYPMTFFFLVGVLFLFLKKKFQN